MFPDRRFLAISLREVKLLPGGFSVKRSPRGSTRREFSREANFYRKHELYQKEDFVPRSHSFFFIACIVHNSVYRFFNGFLIVLENNFAFYESAETSTSLNIGRAICLIADTQMEQGYRSEVQERALVVSLQMFSLILERGVSLLKAQLDSGKEPRLVVGEDLQVLLPAIKVLSLFPSSSRVNTYRAGAKS